MGNLCQVITFIMVAWQGHLYHWDGYTELQPTDLGYPRFFGKISLIVEKDADCIVSMAGSEKELLPTAITRVHPANGY